MMTVHHQVGTNVAKTLFCCSAMKEQVILHTGLKLRLGLKAPAFSKSTNFINTASFGRSQYDFTELAENSTVTVKYKLLILCKNKDLVRGSTNT